MSAFKSDGCSAISFKKYTDFQDQKKPKDSQRITSSIPECDLNISKTIMLTAKLGNWKMEPVHNCFHSQTQAILKEKSISFPAGKLYGVLALTFHCSLYFCESPWNTSILSSHLFCFIWLKSFLKSLKGSGKR